MRRITRILHPYHEKFVMISNTYEKHLNIAIDNMNVKLYLYYKPHIIMIHDSHDLPIGYVIKQQQTA